METALVTQDQQQPSMLSRQSGGDVQLITMWLHGRSPQTQRAYRQDAEKFFRFVGVDLRSVTLDDLQSYANSLTGGDATRARKLASVKSLLKFAHITGYSLFNVGAVLRLPKIKNTLAERILTEEQVMRIVALEPDRRNAVLLRLLYTSAGRVSEVCALKWKDAQDRNDGAGQVNLFGKGGKTRTVLLNADTWAVLQSIRGESTPDSPIFASRKGHGHLDPSQVARIVGIAARRAGVTGNVSPHWFRHSHASHALDRNAGIHVVQATLGHASLATTSRYVHARPNESSALYLPL